MVTGGAIVTRLALTSLHFRSITAVGVQTIVKLAFAMPTTRLGSVRGASSVAIVARHALITDTYTILVTLAEKTSGVVAAVHTVHSARIVTSGRKISCGALGAIGAAKISAARTLAVVITRVLNAILVAVAGFRRLAKVKTLRERIGIGFGVVVLRTHVARRTRPTIVTGTGRSAGAKRTAAVATTHLRIRPNRALMAHTRAVADVLVIARGAVCCWIVALDTIAAIQRRITVPTWNTR